MVIMNLNNKMKLVEAVFGSIKLTKEQKTYIRKTIIALNDEEFALELDKLHNDIILVP